MKAHIFYTVLLEVEAPDTLTAEVNKLTNELGVSYLEANATPEDVLRRAGLIMGIRGLNHDEAMTPELSSQIRIRVLNEEDDDFQWLDLPPEYVVSS